MFVHREACRRYRIKNPNVDKEYYQTNKTELLRKQKEYLQTPRGKELSRLSCLKWAQNNRERSREIKRKHYPKAVKHRQMLRLTEPSFREKERKLSRKNYLKNPQKYIDNAKEWAKQNPEKRLKINFNNLKKGAIPFKITVSQYKWALKSWADTIKKLQGKKCAVCNNTSDEIHHIFYRSLYPELSLNINNGVPLCLTHHYEVHGKCLN